MSELIPPIQVKVGKDVLWHFPGLSIKIGGAPKTPPDPADRRAWHRFLCINPECDECHPGGMP